MKAKRALRAIRAPDEHGAQQRAWTIVRAAYADRVPSAPRRTRWPIALAPALALVVGAMALSPAGATVGRLITRALSIQHAAPAPLSLPTAGRVLVAGEGGAWTVAVDGSKRRLGPWRQASWSPHGLYAAVAGTDQLTAVDPRGTTYWTLAARAVSDPRWFPPTGFRIAYLSGSTLRVVAGDGNDDHLVAVAVASVAPAWRPDHPYELAYVTSRGMLVVQDGESGQLIWSSPPGPAVRGLEWSPDGRRLVVISREAALVYTASGGLIATVALPSGTPAVYGALSPDGHTLALVLGGNQVVLVDLAAVKPAIRRVFAGNGLRELSWSPDGRWLLVTWPAADQWVFVRVAGAPRIEAASRIAEQLSSTRSVRAFPGLDGWCCTVPGSAG